MTNSQALLFSLVKTLHLLVCDPVRGRTRPPEVPHLSAFLFDQITVLPRAAWFKCCALYGRLNRHSKGVGAHRRSRSGAIHGIAVLEGESPLNDD